MTQSDTLGFSVSRADSTQPAEPAPTTTTSNSASKLDLFMNALLLPILAYDSGRLMRRIGSRGRVFGAGGAHSCTLDAGGARLSTTTGRRPWEQSPAISVRRYV